MNSDSSLNSSIPPVNNRLMTQMKHITSNQLTNVLNEYDLHIQAPDADRGKKRPQRLGTMKEKFGVKVSSPSEKHEVKAAGEFSQKTINVDQELKKIEDGYTMGRVYKDQNTSQTPSFYYPNYSQVMRSPVGGSFPKGSRSLNVSYSEGTTSVEQSGDYMATVDEGIAPNQYQVDQDVVSPKVQYGAFLLGERFKVDNFKKISPGPGHYEPPKIKDSKFLANFGGNHSVKIKDFKQGLGPGSYLVKNVKPKVESLNFCKRLGHYYSYSTLEKAKDLHQRLNQSKLRLNTKNYVEKQISNQVNRSFIVKNKNKEYNFRQKLYKCRSDTMLNQSVEKAENKRIKKEMGFYLKKLSKNYDQVSKISEYCVLENFKTNLYSNFLKFKKIKDKKTSFMFEK